MSNQAKYLIITKKVKKPDQVNHLGLDNSDWTKRVKSYELSQHVH